MQFSVCIQDPTYAGTTYLYEAILAAAEQASAWRGLYAFATRDGVDHLIEDKVIYDLMNSGGEIDLVVGVDAVTNRGALERMQELERHYVNFRPKVFWNENRGLFHPKISDFRLADGGNILIVGSGNLTPGGLMGNFEAYTVITANPGEIDTAALDDFVERHADVIRSIDNKALECASSNIIHTITATRRSDGGTHRTRVRTTQSTRVVRPTAAFNRIMLAQVPGAGGRWAQVHFNASVIREYFRLTRFDIERVYLTHVLADGSRDGVEVRRCVYSSDSNRNHKIEIGAARGIEYPKADPPLLVFRERQLRTYDYMLLLPSESGYGPVRDLSDRLPSPGRGFPRPITDLQTLRRAWPDCPLLYVHDGEWRNI